MRITSIEEIQGQGLFSPLAGHELSTRGVVIGSTRKGYFIQDPDGDPESSASLGLFVFERHHRPPVGALVEVHGRVVDYRPDEDARPTTQLIEESTTVLERRGPPISPFWLTAERVIVGRQALATLLNRLEGMLVGVQAGATFVAPSNPFGDYVLLPPGAELRRTAQGGVLISPEEPLRWLPGFRVIDYDEAPLVHVGAELLEPMIGPLNYRVASYQIAAAVPVRVSRLSIESESTRLRGSGSQVTVMTLNGFNLDAKVEDPSKVHDPRRDVDDDLGEGRFRALGRAIVRQGAAPSVVALQEIQDSDGAEISETVEATRTYAALIAEVRRAGGPSYSWLDIAPEEGADGGQPGGNIRNAYLYDPRRVQPKEGTLRRLGADSPAFEGTRKPLAVRFRPVGGRGELEVINVHLSSKRHQRGVFSPELAGVDPRLELRLQQARLIADRLAELRAQGVDYYVTGDFNDVEFSEPLRILTDKQSVNLVETLPEPLRFDYNHRGMSQALMHGIVSARQAEAGAVAYEILHANALIGVKPGEMGDKASDHGYVIARLDLDKTAASVEAL